MDIITYIQDLSAFRVEALSKAESNTPGFSIDTDGNVNYNVTKIPVHYSGNESICIVRLINQEEKDSFNDMNSCKRLGVVEDLTAIFDNDECKDTYERVRGDRIVTVKSPDGSDIQIELPYLIGSFQ